MSLLTISRENPLILASNSPRRRRLLGQIGLPFRPVPSGLEEQGIGGEPAAQALLLAEKKAMAVYGRCPNRWILGADTIVLIGERILGKPRDLDDAHAMLRLLSGKAHQVITAYSLLYPSGQLARSEAVSTRVTLKALSDEEIKAYAATGEPFGKAGSYAIQGIGAFMVESISGSYTNVVGLPVCALIKSLLAAGALKRFPISA